MTDQLRAEAERLQEQLIMFLIDEDAEILPVDAQAVFLDIHAALRKARNDALDEAIKRMEDIFVKDNADGLTYCLGDFIRSLKTKEPSHEN